MEWDTELDARESLGYPDRRIRYLRVRVGRVIGAVSYNWPSRTQVRGWVVPNSTTHDRMSMQFDSVEEAMQRIALLAQLEGYS